MLHFIAQTHRKRIANTAQTQRKSSTKSKRVSSTCELPERGPALSHLPHAPELQGAPSRRDLRDLALLVIG